MQVPAYAVPSSGAPLVPHTVTRREVGPHDVAIDVKFSGICHSDIHQGREEWGGALFPMVPGHEIAGIVVAVGDQVTKVKVGDHAGIGCMVNSCGTCANCLAGEEHYCTDGGNTPTYNGYERDGITQTYGGYSTYIVCTEHFVLRLPDALPLDAAALAVRRHHDVDTATQVGCWPGHSRGRDGLGRTRAYGSQAGGRHGRTRHDDFPLAGQGCRCRTTWCDVLRELRRSGIDESCRAQHGSHHQHRVSRR